jgi:hypothetical protein
MRRSNYWVLIAFVVLLALGDKPVWPSPPSADQRKADQTNGVPPRQALPKAIARFPILVAVIKRGSNLMGMETMLQITVLSRVKQMALADLLKAPIAGPHERKPLTVLAASWDEMVETMKKEGLTPLRPLAVTTIYTEALPDDPHFRRETVSYYGFRPIALLPDLLNPEARNAAKRTDDARLMDEALSDSVGWNTIVNRIRGVGSDPDFAPDLDVHTWITYLVDRHSEGKTEKEVVTRELRFLVRAGEIQALAIRR